MLCTIINDRQRRKGRVYNCNVKRPAVTVALLQAFYFLEGPTALGCGLQARVFSFYLKPVFDDTVHAESVGITTLGNQVFGMQTQSHVVFASFR